MTGTSRRNGVNSVSERSSCWAGTWRARSGHARLGVLFVVSASLCLLTMMGCDGRGASPAEKLQSEHPGGRIGGCVAAAEQRDLSVLPLLVACLEDPDVDVRLFAIGALRRLTGQTLGYRYFADARERAGALRRWQRWLEDRSAAGEGG